MSTTPDTETSDRAEGRTFDLLTHLRDELRKHPPLTNRLEYPDSVEAGFGARQVVLAPRLKRIRQSSAAEPPDVVVAVGYVTGSTRWENRQDRKTHNAQITFECRDGVLSGLGTSWSAQIIDEIHAAVTEDDDPDWHNPQISGGTDGLQWRDDIGRWQAVVSMRVDYWGYPNRDGPLWYEPVS